MNAIVVSAIRIPADIIGCFLNNNAAETEKAAARLFLIGDSYFGEPPIFSLARASNYGIRMAIEHGAKVVMKTDIDVVFLGNLKGLLDVDNKTAKVPRYGDVTDYASRYGPKDILPKGQGTICMTARNWEKLQGYDERYVGWGGEDNELCRRIKKTGIKIDDSDVVAHIHHTQKWNRDGFNPNRNREHNRIPALEPGAQPNWGKPGTT